MLFRSVGTGSAYLGSFGFGPYQDQIAYFKDVTVNASNGSQIYQDSLMSEDILGEYEQAPLDKSICLDGGKRDRLVWTGDFYHTVSVVAASSARWDQLVGTIALVLDTQLTEGPFEGLVQISPFMGAVPEFNEATGLYGGLLDYQDLFLAGVGDFYHYSGQFEPLRSHWSQIKAQAAAKLKYINPATGLVDSAVNFLGPANGTAVTGVFAYALKQLAPLARALGDTPSAELYESTSAALVQAINDKLWNPELGTWSLSINAPSNYSSLASDGRF